MRKNSIKNTRINGEVQKILAEIIRSEIKDPRIPEFTSIVSVEVAPILKTARRSYQSLEMMRRQQMLWRD